MGIGYWEEKAASGKTRKSPCVPLYDRRIPSGCATMSGSFLTGPPREAGEGGKVGIVLRHPSMNSGQVLRMTGPIAAQPSAARNDRKEEAARNDKEGIRAGSPQDAISR